MDSKIGASSRQRASRSGFQRKCTPRTVLQTLAAAIIFICSCAQAPKKTSPAPAHPSATKELQKIEVDYRSGAYEKALKRLAALTEKHPETDIADDANILTGKIYCQLGDNTNCYRAYISVLNSAYSSPRELEARVGAANALFKLGRYDEALNLTSQPLKYSDVSTETKLQLFNLRYQIQQQTGDRIEALKSLAYLAEYTPQAPLKSKYRIRSTEIVESQLKEEELRLVSSDSSFGSLRAIALYKLGSLYFDQRDYERAENSFNTLKSVAPDTDLSLNADDFLRQISARRRVDPLVIGAVLPLTGKYSNIGYKTLRGLEFGLGIRSRPASEFKLAVVDSAASPDVARRGVERLIVENSAIALVGDIVSRSAEVVAQKSDELGVPNIGLSQKSGITDLGPFVFQNALTSASQVRELVRVAMDVHGMKRFAILYPNNGYGTEYANLFWDEVLARGGQIRAAQVYAPDERDFRGVIRRLVGTYFIEDRQSEYEYYLQDWYSQQKVVNSRTQAPEDLLPPIVDFDAIFVPDSVKSLGQIASMLIVNEVLTPRLIGTNLWNTPDILARGTKLIENSLFVDAQFAITNSWRNSNFYREFAALYGEPPTVFEAQAYDVALALKSIVQSGARSRAAVKEALANLKDFPGSLGAVSVNSHREFSRPLTVLSVVEGQIREAGDPVKTLNK